MLIDYLKDGAELQGPAGDLLNPTLTRSTW